MRFDWRIMGQELQERVVEHAAAVIRSKPQRIGYITVAENNNPALGGSPVVLHVIKVDRSERYRGAIARAVDAGARAPSTPRPPTTSGPFRRPRPHAQFFPDAQTKVSLIPPPPVPCQHTIRLSARGAGYRPGTGLTTCRIRCWMRWWWSFRDSCILGFRYLTQVATCY